MLAPRPLHLAHSFARSTYIARHPTRRLFSTVRMGTPVILCGKTEAIGVGVIANLKPEYEVIHFVTSPEGGAAQIPAILSGEQSVQADSDLGSKDYSRPVAAVILGGGYDDAAAEIMLKATRAHEGARGVPWLRPDSSKPAPPLGPEYGKALVARIKELIPKLERENKMDTTEVHYF